MAFLALAFRKLLRDERGAELVEFAITAAVLLMLILGIADACRAMYDYHFVAYAAQEGTRYAQVRGADWTSSCSTSAPPNFTLTYSCKAAATDVQNYVLSLASTSAIAPGSVSVNTTSSYMWPGTTPSCSGAPCAGCSTNANAQGCYVRVTVSYPFTFMFSYFRRASVTLSATSEGEIQY